MLLETYMGTFIEVTRDQIEKMTRGDLKRHLEFRGFAVYDDEETADLRECALSDFDGG